jgi:NAD(P) transhydrogenase subunit alpha
MTEIVSFIFEYRQEIFVIVLAIFLGFEVIAHVPSVLHTPLMSGANAISGVVIIGALIYAGHAHSWVDVLIGSIAIFFATLNVVGGFAVTDRMLEMFKKKKTEKK